MSLRTFRIPHALVLILITFFPTFIVGKEISILPAYISGEVPAVLGTRREAGFELSRLSRHYLKRNFFTEITDPKLIENYLNQLFIVPPYEAKQANHKERHSFFINIQRFGFCR